METFASVFLVASCIASLAGMIVLGILERRYQREDRGQR